MILAGSGFSHSCQPCGATTAVTLCWQGLENAGGGQKWEENPGLHSAEEPGSGRTRGTFAPSLYLSRDCWRLNKICLRAKLLAQQNLFWVFTAFPFCFLSPLVSIFTPSSPQCALVLNLFFLKYIDMACHHLYLDWGNVCPWLGICTIQLPPTPMFFSLSPCVCPSLL